MVVTETMAFFIEIKQKIQEKEKFIYFWIFNARYNKTASLNFLGL